MVEIPDRLECFFSASIDQRGDSYSIEIPRNELEEGTISRGDTYRVAVLPRTPQDGDTTARQQGDSAPSTDTVERDPQTPPVEEGDVREVEIETIGDQGDGIAKIDRGYVVIVPGARPDDEVTIEITQARENVAFARVRDDENTFEDPSGLDESLAGETLDEQE
ncbi:MAG TPA: TRAM domain-containing protein [Halococcus sp.]|nr:TRAM domain-containing protein [Halococcus sp.]